MNDPANKIITMPLGKRRLRPCPFQAGIGKMLRNSLAGLMLMLALALTPAGGVAQEAPAAPRLRVALFSDALPGFDAARAQALAARLTAAKRATQVLDAAALADPARFNRDAFDCLILPDSALFPASALENLLRFASHGGSLIALGGPPLSRPCTLASNGSWVENAALQQVDPQTPTGRLLLDFESPAQQDISPWQEDKHPAEPAAALRTVAGGAAGTSHCLEYHDPKLESWDFFTLKLDQPFHAEESLTCFWARGTTETTTLSVEWEAGPGEAWSSRVALTPEWKYFVLAPADFKRLSESRLGILAGCRPEPLPPTRVTRLRLGLLHDNSTLAVGEHRFWFDQLGVAVNPNDRLARPAPFAAPLLATLSPDNRFYPLTSLGRVEPSPLLGDCPLPDLTLLGERAMSPVWRAQSTGYHKGRDARFIPLLKTYDDKGLWNGTLAALLLNWSDPWTNNVYANSAFATVSAGNPAAWADGRLFGVVEQILARLDRGVFLVEGGAELNTYFADAPEVRLGTTVSNQGAVAAALTVRLTVREAESGRVAFGRTQPVQLPPGGRQEVEAYWPVRGQFTADRYTVEVEVLEGERAIDRLTHELLIAPLNPHPRFITTRDGQFMDSDKVWVPFGVNYMPSSGSVLELEKLQNFEHWMGAQPYDPEIVEAELRRIRDTLGMNMVSLFVYSDENYTGNVSDVIERCRRLGLKVNLSLRSNANPVDFSENIVADTIKANRLAESDTVFAYDIACEPWWGGKEIRNHWDADWQAWIVEQYGSQANAEKDWGCAAPRTPAGEVSGPENMMFAKDGPWRVMVAAYRRFVDDFLSHRYNFAIRKIKEHDPNHLVSFRMSDAGNPDMDMQAFPYDLTATAKHVDFFSPECYGRARTSYELARTGVYTASYARSLALKPVFWAEYGSSCWMGSNFAPDPVALAKVAQVYENLFRMFVESKSNGSAAWWYAGGYRPLECSDYGQLNPDGTTRPTQAPREHYVALIRQPDARQLDLAPNVWLLTDRDRWVNGICGDYAALKDQYWKLIDAGKNVGLTTAGRGKNSADVPLTAIGDTTPTATNPPRFLNGEFNRVQVQNAAGQWEEVVNGVTVGVPRGKPVLARIGVGNTGDADWLAPAKGAAPEAGRVWLVALPDAADGWRALLPADVPRYGDADFGELRLSEGLDQPTTLRLRLQAEGRAAFGEILTLRLDPR